MCIVYYTVNPDSDRFPKSYIVRIFKEDKNADVRCIQNRELSPPQPWFAQ